MSITKKEFALLEEAVTEYERGRDTYEHNDRQRQINAKRMEQALNKLARKLVKEGQR